MVILLITVLLPPAADLPSGWRGPGLPTATRASKPCGTAGTGGCWCCARCPGAAWPHSRAVGQFGAGRAPGPCLEVARPVSGVLVSVRLVRLVLRLVSKRQHQRWTRMMSKDLASSKACCKDLARLRLPHRRGRQRLGRYSNRSEPRCEVSVKTQRSLRSGTVLACSSQMLSVSRQGLQQLLPPTSNVVLILYNLECQAWCSPP